MYVWHRRLFGLAVALATLTLSSGARAWIETSIRSDFATIDLERDGSAIVAHEIVMKIRGGPLRGFELAGVDSDATLLPDGTVTRARSGRTAGTPIPLLIEQREDGSVRLEIDREKGIRRGSYLFKFRYRTNLLERELIREDGARVTISWVGPRFGDGIDSARVVFRLPSAKLAPRLPPIDSEQTALGLQDDPGGVFLSNLRRAPDKDELEVVRPHIAKGEPVVWRVQADARAFDAFAPPAPAPESAPVAAETAPLPRQRALLIAAALAIALLYGTLVALKWHAFSHSCEIRRARPRAVVPLPTALRAALAGASLSAAAGVAVFTSYPTAAGVLLVLAMALAAQRGPLAALPLRGPGRWLVFSDEEAFEKRRPKLPGRWLDTGSLVGFFWFALALAGFAYGAARLLPSSPYHAVMLALASASLLPIFCTGRGSELPADPVSHPRRLMKYLAKKLRRNPALKAAAWVRVPMESKDPDELRLLVVPRRALAGFMAIEVGLEYQHGGGGPVALPFVLVRVQDGSMSYAALPRDVAWMRGRKPEERVAVVRPKLPTRRMTLALVQRLAQLLTDSSRSDRRSCQQRTSLARAA